MLRAFTTSPLLEGFRLLNDPTLHLLGTFRRPTFHRLRQVRQQWQRCHGHVRWLVAPCAHSTRLYRDSLVTRKTDSGVHVVRAPIMVHTSSSKYCIDETPEIKLEIFNETNKVLRAICGNSFELLDVHRVAPGFSLRRHVAYRKYVYRLRVANNYEIYENTRDSPSVSCTAEAFRSWTIPPGFDLQRANELCKLMEGERNIASFMKVQRSRQRQLSPADKLTTRRMYLVQVTNGTEICDIPDPNFQYYNVEVVARSFLREQIRRMVRVLVKYACGSIDKDQIRILYDYPHPNTFIECGMQSAPSHGLYLVNCVYDPKMFVDPVPQYVHNWDQAAESDEHQTTSGNMINDDFS